MGRCTQYDASRPPRLLRSQCGKAWWAPKNQTHHENPQSDWKIKNKPCITCPLSISHCPTIHSADVKVEALYLQINWIMRLLWWFIKHAWSSNWNLGCSVLPLLAISMPQSWLSCQHYHSHQIRRHRRYWDVFCGYALTVSNCIS